MNVHGNTTVMFNGNVSCTVNPYVFPGQHLTADNDSISITAPGETDGAVTITVNAGGTFTETMFVPVTRTFFMDVKETYHADYHIDQPDDSSFANHMYNNSTVTETCFGGVGVFNFVVLQTDTYLVHAELTGVHAEFMPIHAEATLIHLATKDVKTYGSAFDSDTATQGNCKCEADIGPHQGPGHMPP